MCTLIVGFDPAGPRPLIVGANRDERLDRPAEGPKWRSLGGHEVFAPLDLEAGGTWMGVSRKGVFCALTNRFGVTRKGERSRGAIVSEALACDSAQDARAWMAELKGDRESGFHLLVADRSQGFVAVGDGEALTVHALAAPGGLVITERAFGAAQSGRQDRLGEEFEPDLSSAYSVDRLAEVLADRSGPNGFDAVNVSVPEHNYGTRSSAIVEMFARPQPSVWRWTDGPPTGATDFHPIELEV